jgi:succinate dehydrogenase/fumarate reductase iron-sulfur protein
LEKKISVKILRYNPEKDDKPRHQTFEVPITTEGMSVLNVLNYIYERLDSTVSYYKSCRIGKCRGCMISVNGKTRYACTTAVKGSLVLEPVRGFGVIKDLVVDLEKRIPT